MAAGEGTEEVPAVEFRHCTFGYDGGPPALKDVNLKVAPGSRVLLVGDNGAGKSTMLRLLSGRHLPSEEQVLMFGRNVFRDLKLNHERQYMSGDWGRHSVAFTGYGSVMSADIAVKDMQSAAQARYADRAARLQALLSINLEWRMFQLSDGQRRRVQCFLQLLRPSRVLLCDEITSELDVLTRADLLAFLKEESEERGVTVLYATHIFDGLNEWFTHICYVDQGCLTKSMPVEECEEFQAHLRAKNTAPLLRTVEHWLRQSKAAREESSREALLHEPAAGPGAHDEDFDGFAPGRGTVWALEEEREEGRKEKEQAKKVSVDGKGEK